MPAVNEAAIAAGEMEKVLPKVRKVYESDDHFYSHIRKHGDVEVVSYREMRIPLELRPGGNFQYFNPDGGDLGRGSGPGLDRAVVRPVFLSENIEYTKLAQWSTDDRRKAIINAVRRLTAGALIELRRQIDAQLMQPGTGVIGVISAVATAAGVDTYTLGTDGFGSRLIRYGQIVQIFDVNLTTNRGKARVTMHDGANNQISVTPAIAGATATDRIVTDGLADPTALPALYGVPYHHSNASTGTWLGFDRAATPEIRSNRVNGGGSALSLPLPRLALARIGNRLGENHNVSATAWMHPAQMQAYEDIGQSIMMINKTGGNSSLDLYFNGSMQMAGIKMRGHFNWDKTRIDLIVDSAWGRAEILPIGFYKTDGRNIFEIRGASGGVATADIFYMVVGMQTFVNNPAATAYIDSLAVPAGY